MPENKWSEKRRNVRVSIETRAQVRIIDPEAAAEGRSSETPINRLVDLLHLLEEKKDPLITFLIDAMNRIDEKVDRIAEHLTEKTSSAKAVLVQTLDISGAGMRFVMEGTVKEGQYLDILLYIPGLPMCRFQLCGKVVNTRPHQDAASARMEVGAAFVNMTEDEQEALISFVFYHQRKTIRQNRQPEGGDPNVGTDR